jgi:hypothetical protein
MKQILTIIRDHKNFFLGLLLVTIWVLPGFLLSSSDYSLEYDYIQNVRIAASLNKDYLIPLDFGGFNFIPEHQGSELLRLILGKVCGLSVQELQSLPIGAILVPLAFYIVCRQFLNPKVAALLSVSVAFDPTVVFSSYHTSIYAWSRPLLLTFVLLYSMILQKKTPGLVILSIMVFTTLFTIYWTGSALMISFTFLVNVLLATAWVTSVRRGASAPSALTISNAIAFLVIYLGFGEFAYNLLPSIIGQGASGQLGSAFFSLTQRVLQLIGLAPPEETVYATYGGTSPTLTIQVFRYLLMSFPVIWLLIKGVIKATATRKIILSQNPTSLVLWSLVGTVLSHTLLYSSYGHASTRYVALLGPLIAAMALAMCTTSDRIRVGFATVLGLLACANFAIAYPQVPQHASWAEIRPAATWFLEKAEQKILISNVGTYGMFAVESAPNAIPPMYTCYSDTEYASVINAEDEASQSQEPRGYIVIDKKVTSHEICPGFLYFEPLSGQLDQINHNTNINSIYDNGSIRILAPVKETSK